MKKALDKILRPPLKLIVITDIIAIPLVIYALAFLKDDSAISYAAYFLSAYALVVTVVSFKRLTRRIRELLTGDELHIVRSIKALMRRNRITRRYLESRDFRAEVSLYISLAINLFYAAFKGLSGVHYSSAWLVSIGFYYLALSAIRFMLMRSERVRKGQGSDARTKLHEYRAYRLCGCMMMVLDLTVAGMSVQMIWQDRAYEYSQTVVIISAAYTFYSFISAITNVVSFRRRDNAILSAAKDLNMSGAVMSMFILQAAMIHTFDDSGSSFPRVANSITGGCVLVIILAIATFMIINGTKKIKQYS